MMQGVPLAPVAADAVMDPAWLLRASRADLVAALAGPTEAITRIQEHLRYVDDPATRRLLIEALHPGAFAEAGEPAANPPSPAAAAPSGGRSRDTVAPEPPWRIADLIEPGYQLIDCEQMATIEDRRHAVPLINRIAAGDGVDTVQAEEMPPGVADAYLIYTGAPASAFAVRVVGDSMEPEYRDGDVVVVDGAAPVRSGVCCVIYQREGGERLARLKQLEIRGAKAYLRSTNPDHRTLTVPSRHVEAFRVIDHLPRFVHRTR